MADTKFYRECESMILLFARWSAKATARCGPGRVYGLGFNCSACGIMSVLLEVGGALGMNALLHSRVGVVTNYMARWELVIPV